MILAPSCEFVTYLLNYLLTHLLTYLLTYVLTYSMVQSPSWEANWFAASQVRHACECGNEPSGSVNCGEFVVYTG